jgi:hypothetical protein
MKSSQAVSLVTCFTVLLQKHKDMTANVPRKKVFKKRVTVCPYVNLPSFINSECS